MYIMYIYASASSALQIDSTTPLCHILLAIGNTDGYMYLYTKNLGIPDRDQPKLHKHTLFFQRGR